MFQEDVTDDWPAWNMSVAVQQLVLYWKMEYYRPEEQDRRWGVYEYVSR